VYSRSAPLDERCDIRAFVRWLLLLCPIVYIYTVSLVNRISAMFYDPEAIYLTFNSANVCEIWGPRKVNIDISIFWVVGLFSRVACWKSTKLHGVTFQIYIYVTITDSPANSGYWHDLLIRRPTLQKAMKVIYTYAFKKHKSPAMFSTVYKITLQRRHPPSYFVHCSFCIVLPRLTHT
jgi:hypothetical protein